MFIVKLGAVALLLLVGGLGIATHRARARWEAETRRLDARLTGGSSEARPLEPTELPDPLRRFLARSARPDLPRPRSVRVVQQGTFNMGDDDWRAFTATEVFRVAAPAFYWDARIRMAPGVEVFVRDFYVDGEARMTAKVAGLFTVVDESPGPLLAEGALARFLAEAAWLPSRLVTGPGLTWTPVDHASADATLTDHEYAVTLRFEFDERGDLLAVSGLRPRAVEGGFEITPWVGRFSGHRDFGGYRIPAEGEVAWIVDGTERPYWRGTITAVSYVDSKTGWPDA